ncbi:MAG: electron transporter RnfC, partial [Candidatus Riflebacteria bacterium]
MLSTRTFEGGLHPPELKNTADKGIVNLPLPEKVILHVSQHIGAPAKPLFKITDKVETGQVIAEPGGFVSARIHATISGKIIGVGNFMHPFGVPSPAIVIERSQETPEPEYSEENGFNLDLAEIKTRIQNA